MIKKLLEFIKDLSVINKEELDVDILNDKENELKSEENIEIEHNEEILEEKKEYEFPSIELLEKQKNDNNEECVEKASLNLKNLQQTLNYFGIKSKVINFIIGPTFITYEIKLDEGVSINEIRRRKKEISLSLGKEHINIKIIPERQLVGIEIERDDRKFVSFREIIESDEFKNSASKLTVALGKDTYGRCKTLDIKEFSPILVSGKIDSGRSMFLHVLINSIIYKAKPNEVKFLIIDTNALELSMYNKIPHLVLPIISDQKKVSGVLAWICQEMENRYAILQNEGVNNIDEYNEKKDENKRLADIILIIDEYTDLIVKDQKDVEENILLLIQRASEVGIHLIIVIGNPSSDGIDEIVNANIPTRITFKLPSKKESKMILDIKGAENLLGDGDMFLKKVGKYKPKRYQVAYISDEELISIYNNFKNKVKFYDKRLLIGSSSLTRFKDT